MLVSVPLIKPIQDGRKTVTRRLAGLEKINTSPDRFLFKHMECIESEGIFSAVFLDIETTRDVKVRCPYGGIGTRLWIRENWYAPQCRDHLKPREMPSLEFTKPGYMADGNKPDWAGKTRPGIHMPRWLSRITVLNEGTFPERLNDITEAGAKLEGIPMSAMTLAINPDPYRSAFFKTFSNLNGDTLIAVNPWVWVVKFKLCK